MRKVHLCTAETFQNSVTPRTAGEVAHTEPFLYSAWVRVQSAYGVAEESI